jgi:streptomycin 6-kinase
MMSTETGVSPQAASRIVDAFPEEGPRWLRELATTERTLARQWGLQLGPAFAGSRTASVRTARISGGPAAVLKVPVIPSDTITEFRALRYWNGDAAPSAFDRDETSGALLLEFIEGEPLSMHDASENSLERVGAFLSRLHARRQTLPQLPSLEEHLAPLREALRARERSSQETAESLVEENAVRAWLRRNADSMSSATVIHGDLHTRNVLLTPDDQLKCVDPYGVVGDPARDAGAVALSCRSPVPLPDRLEILCARCQADPLRAAAHAFSMAVGALRYRRAFRSTDETLGLMSVIDLLRPAMRAAGAI